MKPAQPFNALPYPQQAGIMCNDPRFQRFAAVRSGFPGDQFTNTAAAEFLRTACHIASRTVLQTDRPARERFEILKTEFDAFTGKIAAQR